MSVRKSVLVGMLVVVATTLVIASAFAQSGPGNPSGGTWLRQTVEEGTGSTKSTVFPAGTSFGAGWTSWVASFSVSRSTFTVAPRPTETRSFLAAARRTALKR